MNSSIFKKSAIAIALCGIAGTSYADLITGFFGGAEGAWLQARNGDLNFLTVEGTGPGPITTYNLPLNNQKWAYRLFGGATFCGGDDVEFSYLIFHTNNFRRVPDPIGPASPILPGISQPRWLFPSLWTQINGHVTFNLDDYYMAFGHTLQVSEPWKVRIAAGFEYARVDSDMTVKAHFVAVPLRQFEGYVAKDGTRGFGPRLEVDTTYQMPFNFAVFGRTNAAVLVSHRNISLNSVDVLTGLLPDVNFRQRTVIIPKAGIKLGAGYYFTWTPVGGEGAAAMPSTTFGLELGWEGEAFIHAIERPYHVEVSQSSTDSLADPVAFNFKTHVSNYYYQGPFIAATLSTNWF